ncbi:helix-turn-helix domain-containing protein [Lentibacillus halophilus]|uniref:Helix-turn-helix domain-containing protein n=1 Tax=Lentibacillus halophilus TaxID=295065 RepID=A0ABN0Z5V8_9BACI
MCKYERNELCPCGSGKKYKKCCGAFNITDFSSQVINRELDRLHQQFVSFATNKHDDTIHRQITRYATRDLDNDDMNQIYESGLMIWILLNVACLQRGQTLFDAFYHTYQSQIEHQAKHTFSLWGHSVPSVYEVIDIDEASSQLFVRELLSDTAYPLPMAEGETFKHGSLLIGTLVPYFDRFNFFYSIVKLYAYNKENVITLLQHYSSKDDGLKTHFPDFLAEALSLETDADDANPQRGQVVQLFANHMVDKDISDDIILQGIDLWNDYCKQAKPSFVKSESYAAALEYFVQKTILNNTSMTQGQVASEYDASPGTVSAHYRKLSQTLASNTTP